MNAFWKTTILSLIAANSFAGHGVGNSDDSITLAYDKEVTERVIEAMQSDYLKLTAAEIEEREKSFSPIYENYTSLTVGKVFEKINDQYALNFFEDDESQSLDNKEGLLNAMTLYYSGQSVDALRYADQVAVPGRSQLRIDYGEMTYRRLDRSGEVVIDSATNMRSWSAIDHQVSSKKRSLAGKKKKILTTMGGFVYEEPWVLELLEGIKASNIKALDANIYLAAGRITATVSVNGYNRGQVVPYHVVYPQLTELAPVPSPIVYLNKDATREEVAQLLNDHAPLIYAYNKVFDAQLMPKVRDLNSAFEGYGEVSAELEKLAQKIGRENAVSALFNGFLMVNYAIAVGAVGTAGAVLSLPAILTSPVWGPIVIAIASTGTSVVVIR